MNSTATGLAALSLLVIGVAIGQKVTEPVVVNQEPTKTIIREEIVEVPGPTETVYVDRVPDACMYMVDVALRTNRRTFAGLNLAMEMLDALQLARQGVAAADSALITNSDNELRRIQSRTLNHLPQADLGGNPLREAQRECKDALE